MASGRPIEIPIITEPEAEDRTDIAPLIEAIRVLQKAEDFIDNSRQTTWVERANALTHIAREYRAIYDTL